MELETQANFPKEDEVRGRLVAVSACAVMNPNWVMLTVLLRTMYTRLLPVSVTISR